MKKLLLFLVCLSFSAEAGIIIDPSDQVTPTQLKVQKIFNESLRTYNTDEPLRQTFEEPDISKGVHLTEINYYYEYEPIETHWNKDGLFIFDGEVVGSRAWFNDKYEYFVNKGGKKSFLSKNRGVLNSYSPKTIAFHNSCSDKKEQEKPKNFRRNCLAEVPNNLKIEIRAIAKLYKDGNFISYIDLPIGKVRSAKLDFNKFDKSAKIKANSIIYNPGKPLKDIAIEGLSLVSHVGQTNFAISINKIPNWMIHPVNLNVYFDDETYLSYSSSRATNYGSRFGEKLKGKGDVTFRNSQNANFYTSAMPYKIITQHICDEEISTCQVLPEIGATHNIYMTKEFKDRNGLRYGITKNIAYNDKFSKDMYYIKNINNKDRLTYTFSNAISIKDKTIAEYIATVISVLKEI